MLALLVALALAGPHPERNADPDAPASGIAWRGGNARAVIAVLIPFAEPDHGFVLRLPAFVELHNESIEQFVPWENWRARLVVQAGWRFMPELTVLGALEHESDHPSNMSTFEGFLNLNSVAARVESRLTIGDEQLELDATLRLHVLTCTEDGVACALDAGLGGSRTFEANASAVWSHPLGCGWATLFVAHAAVLVGAERARAEARAVMRAGVSLDTERAGGFSFFVEGLLGNPVGIDRGATVHELGLGFRWAPR